MFVNKNAFHLLEKDTEKGWHQKFVIITNSLQAEIFNSVGRLLIGVIISLCLVYIA